MIFPGERRQRELILGLSLSHSGIYATEYLTPPRHAISISCRNFETTAAARFRPDSPIQVTPEVTPSSARENAGALAFQELDDAPRIKSILGPQKSGVI